MQENTGNSISRYYIRFYEKNKVLLVQNIWKIFPQPRRGALQQFPGPPCKTWTHCRTRSASGESAKRWTLYTCLPVSVETGPTATAPKPFFMQDVYLWWIESWWIDSRATGTVMFMNGYIHSWSIFLCVCNGNENKNLKTYFRVWICNTCIYSYMFCMNLG